MEHFSLIVDNQDFARPRGRSLRYADPHFTPTQITSLRCWLHYSHRGAVSGDWADIGLPVGEGQVLHVLFDSGQTGQLVVRHFEDSPVPFQHFLMLPTAPGKVFKVYHIRPTGKPVVWPYKVVPWTDRTTALSLLDNVVYMWPRMPNQHMGSVLEPLRVVSLLVRDKGRIGLGLTQHTTEDMTFTPGPGWWPREIHKVSQHAPARYATAEEAMHPPIILWGMENKTQDYLTAITVREETKDAEWWEDQSTRFAGCRLLQFEPLGGDPLLWGDSSSQYGPLPTIDEVLSGAASQLQSANPTLAPVPYGLPAADLKRLHGVWWCQRCLAESGGLDKVRAVENGMCVLHLQLQNRTSKLLSGITCPDSPNGRHKWVRPQFGLAYCKWGCGVRPKGNG